MPGSGVRGSVLGWVVKDGFKEAVIMIRVRDNWCGDVIVEALRGADGNLEHVGILLVHFGCLEKNRC